ncbi:hypothetical protein [Thiolapillus sp.]|uniref:hypothetical protein n=1 Tax=Thiolapillus sp. TaxID=2017437 RepID=UPI003AF69BC5
MEIVIVELSTEQEDAIEQMKKLYKQQWKKELLASWENTDYSFQLTDKQVFALEALKKIIGKNNLKNALENMQSINETLKIIQ